jgi:hypothetical protein
MLEVLMIEYCSIEHAKRKVLSFATIPEGCIGYDCEGKVIKEGDIVEVVVAESSRERSPEFTFCGRGKRGKASKHFSFPIGWTITVDFGNGYEQVGCGDYRTRLVNPA